jgi:hypothetical protein
MSAVQAAALPIAGLTRFGSCALRRQTAAPAVGADLRISG